MKKLYTLVLVTLLLGGAVRFGVGATVTQTSTNSITMARFDALIPAMKTQVQALIVDAAALIAQINAMTNRVVITTNTVITRTNEYVTLIAATPQFATFAFLTDTNGTLSTNSFATNVTYATNSVCTNSQPVTNSVVITNAYVVAP